MIERRDPYRDRSDPTATRRYYCTLVRPRPGRPQEGSVLSPRAVGCWTHYYQGRTHPHLRNAELCEGCQLHVAQRWYAYLGVTWGPRGERGVLECPPSAVASAPELRPSSAISLRGLSYRARRTGRSYSSPVEVLIGAAIIPPHELPEEHDVTLFLLKLWGYTDCAALCWDDLPEEPPAFRPPGLPV